MNCPSCRSQNESSASVCFACGTALDKALAALSEGALFASRYEILGPLGRGGMGMVYRAFDRELGETVAIKVLRDGLAGDGAERRLERESAIMAGLEHPGIVPVHDAGELADGRWF